MNFRDTPGRFTRTQRTSRNAPLESIAIERFEPSAGHRWVVPVGALLAIFVFVLFAMEYFS